MTATYTLAELAEKYALTLIGDPSVRISNIAPLQEAKEGDISFLDNAKYQKFLASTKASAVVVTKDFAQEGKGSFLVTDHPYLDFAKISHLFAYQLNAKAGIHPTATISQNADVHATAYIGPNVVVEDGARIGQGAIIKANSFIGENAVIGDNTLLWSNVSIAHHSQIGNDCEIFSGAVIGSDGFGFAPSDAGWFKVPQLGRVIIGDAVTVGSNTTIDRGSTGDTVISTGVKLDNQIQIAHNVYIGEHTAIAACVGIAGSTKIGKHCQLGGGAGISGHLEICDYVGIAGGSIIFKSIRNPGHYSSRGFGMLGVKDSLKHAAKIHKIDKLYERVAELEKQLDKVDKGRD
jgi:UDP-3-O-[3-hydroxymyristoyl] glucosamine N-acyltransferase